MAGRDSPPPTLPIPAHPTYDFSARCGLMACGRREREAVDFKRKGIISHIKCGLTTYFSNCIMMRSNHQTLSSPKLKPVMQSLSEGKIFSVLICGGLVPKSCLLRTSRPSLQTIIGFSFLHSTHPKRGEREREKKKKKIERRHS